MSSLPNGVSAAALTDVRWQKASSSTTNGNCVELGALSDGQVAVRNSRDPHGPALIYTRAEIAALLQGARDGEFDHLM